MTPRHGMARIHASEAVGPVLDPLTFSSDKCVLFSFFLIWASPRMRRYMAAMKAEPEDTVTDTLSLCRMHPSQKLRMSL